MCGLSVCIHSAPSSASQSLQIVKKMNSIVEHRGPDGEGLIQKDNITMGHRRLAIIDLSNNGNQPMNLNDRFHIVFNGEIYNYIELKAELMELGYQFKTNTDTEVILIGYSHFGAKIFQKLNGMWGLVIYDQKSKKLIVSRDRFGEKPIYYLPLNGRILISSEIKQLTPFLEKVEPNMSVIFNYLYIRQEDYSDETFFLKIKSFLPSHYYLLDTSLENPSFVEHRYYSLKENLENEANISKESFISSFKESVKIRLRSDVPNGVLLSGGIDSSSIAAEVSSQLLAKDEMTFFHARSFEHQNDESDKAKFIATELSKKLITFTPSPESLLDQLKTVARIQDQPYGGPSILMGYNIFRKISETSTKVILGGQGADEILLGYERYISSFINPMNLSSLLNIRNFSKKTSISYTNFIKYFFYFRNYHFRRFILDRSRCLKKEFIKNQDYSLVEKTVNAYSDPLNLQVEEIESIQLPHLLRYEDRNSMASSIESRLPFLDHNLVEKALLLSLDSKIFNGWTKYILRGYLESRNLPKIAWQKKKFGFEAPLNFWFENHSEHFLKIINNSNIIKEICIEKEIKQLIQKKDINKLWPYISLALWETEFKVA
jgi:asparagine synthase (glutamine-hydrolysing)